MNETLPLLVIGNQNYSSWSLRPWLFLRATGVEFEVLRIPLDTPRFQAEIGRWSPTRCVPVLHHAGRVVWDSLAICEYAAETFPGVEGWPDDPDARAFARAASAEMHSGFSALRATMPMDCRARRARHEPSPEAARDIARVLAIWREARTRFGAGGPWLCGRFSIADAMFAPVASRFVTYAVTLDETTWGWVDTLMSHPAMREWLRAGAAETEML
ncbi:MAG: glutathione S-transferase family protein [Ectothiorhodospiraceae bacterium]|nr:glutathione S-transferase family protein [Chromatiales bacterium]MCP5154729.1 glutathione S-transferase family protein [Ectothiorhodospiraceae bacterium]